MDDEKRSEGASKSAPATELPTAPPTAPKPTSEPEPIPGRTRSNSYNPFEHRENLDEEPNGLAFTASLLSLDKLLHEMGLRCKP